MFNLDLNIFVATIKNRAKCLVLDHPLPTIMFINMYNYGLNIFVANIKKLFYDLNVQLCQIFLKYFISFLASTRNNNLQDQECDTIVIPNEFQMCQ